MTSSIKNIDLRINNMIFLDNLDYSLVSNDDINNYLCKVLKNADRNVLEDEFVGYTYQNVNIIKKHII